MDGANLGRGGIGHVGHQGARSVAGVPVNLDQWGASILNMQKQRDAGQRVGAGARGERLGSIRV